MPWEQKLLQKMGGYGREGGRGPPSLPWERMKTWEVLFDREQAMAGWELRAAGVKWMRTKTHKCGKDWLECEVYPMWDTQGREGARQAASQATREAQEKINRRNGEKKLRRLIHTNFGPRDLHVTLTYRGEAPNQARAKKDVGNFIRRIRRMRKKAGLTPVKYIYVLEWEDDPKVKRRIHLHVIMSGGLDRDAVEACWERGYANSDRLQFDDQGLAKLASYILKAPRGGKKWSGSRNLKKPVETVSDHRMSRRRAWAAARDIQDGARNVFEKVYPGYRLVECAVYYPICEMVDGVYICARMRREK